MPQAGERPSHGPTLESPGTLIASLLREIEASQAKRTPATKAGWADTFQGLAQQLGLNLCHPNGARCYTGHSARVTGAIHMAKNNIEL